MLRPRLSLSSRAMRSRWHERNSNWAELEEPISAKATSLLPTKVTEQSVCRLRGRTQMKEWSRYQSAQTEIVLGGFH